MALSMKLFLILIVLMLSGAQSRRPHKHQPGYSYNFRQIYPSNDDSCICFKETSASVTEKLNTTNDVERLVLMLYRDTLTKKMMMYLPSVDKQSKLPDFAFEDGDKLINLTDNEKIIDVFKNQDVSVGVRKMLSKTNDVMRKKIRWSHASNQKPSGCDGTTDKLNGDCEHFQSDLNELDDGCDTIESNCDKCTSGYCDYCCYSVDKPSRYDSDNGCRDSGSNYRRPSKDQNNKYHKLYQKYYDLYGNFLDKYKKHNQIQSETKHKLDLHKLGDKGEHVFEYSNKLNQQIGAGGNEKQLYFTTTSNAKPNSHNREAKLAYSNSIDQYSTYNSESAVKQPFKPNKSEFDDLIDLKRVDQYGKPLKSIASYEDGKKHFKSKLQEFQTKEKQNMLHFGMNDKQLHEQVLKNNNKSSDNENKVKLELSSVQNNDETETEIKKLSSNASDENKLESLSTILTTDYQNVNPNGGKQYSSSIVNTAHHTVNSDGQQIENKLNTNKTFGRWFNEQVKSVKKVIMSDSIDVNVFKKHIEETLKKNGMVVSGGILKDTSGNAINVSNLVLRPILIGDSVGYDSILVNKTKFTDVPYLESVLMSLIDPPKNLGIIPLRRIYLPDRNRHEAQLHSDVVPQNRHNISSVSNSSPKVSGTFSQRNRLYSARPLRSKSSRKRKGTEITKITARTDKDNNMVQSVRKEPLKPTATEFKSDKSQSHKGERQRRSINQMKASEENLEADIYSTPSVLNTEDIENSVNFEKFFGENIEGKSENTRRSLFSDNPEIDTGFFSDIIKNLKQTVPSTDLVFKPFDIISLIQKFSPLQLDTIKKSLKYLLKANVADKKGISTPSKLSKNIPIEINNSDLENGITIVDDSKGDSVTRKVAPPGQIFNQNNAMESKGRSEEELYDEEENKFESRNDFEMQQSNDNGDLGLGNDGLYNQAVAYNQEEEEEEHLEDKPNRRFIPKEDVTSQDVDSEPIENIVYNYEGSSEEEQPTGLEADDERPYFRIIGGAAATSSGSPICNKGRSGDTD